MTVHLLNFCRRRLRRLLGAWQRLARRRQPRGPRQRLELQPQPLHALEHVRQLCREASLG